MLMSLTRRRTARPRATNCAKLILYATGDTRITGAHVLRSLSAMPRDLALDDISDAALAGNGREAAERLRQGDGRRHPPRCRARRHQPRRPRAASAATECRERRQSSSAPSRARVPPSILAAGRWWRRRCATGPRRGCAIAFVTLGRGPAGGSPQRRACPGDRRARPCSASPRRRGGADDSVWPSSRTAASRQSEPRRMLK